MHNQNITTQVYLDYASTTPLDPRVREYMAPYESLFGLQANPSSLHSLGRKALAGLNEARARTADVLGVLSSEIIFTGSGSESDNLAIIGSARAYAEYGRHMIISAIEHKAVLESAKAMEKEGFQISIAPVTKDGVVDIGALLELVRDDTILVSVMYVNNEVGSIQPIRELSVALARFRKNSELPLLHVDACQAPTILKVRPRELGASLLTLNGGKIYGPKGIGCLWKRSGVQLEPIIHGGSQEFGWRAGTESMALAIGFSRALELAQQECESESKRLLKLNRMLREKVRKIPGVSLNTPEYATPAILNASFVGVEGESLLLDLDHHGICCSTGSACAATDLKPSYVLLAMGISDELAHASLRFSIGRFTTKEDVRRLITILPKSVERIRSVCPSMFTNLAPQTI
jgi:cysteine desulfurase